MSIWILRTRLIVPFNVKGINLFDSNADQMTLWIYYGFSLLLFLTYEIIIFSPIAVGTFTPNLTSIFISLMFNFLSLSLRHSRHLHSHFQDMSICQMTKTSDNIQGSVPVVFHEMFPSFSYLSLMLFLIFFFFSFSFQVYHYRRFSACWSPNDCTNSFFRKCTAGCLFSLIRYVSCIYAHIWA